MDDCMLKYRHKGQPKFVGKVLHIDTGLDRLSVCLHEESGSQTLHIFDSPGGVDSTVARFLYQEGVKQWHHYERDTGLLYTAPILAILDKGIEKHWDGRTRLFLPRDQWQVFPALWYQVPWVKAERIIDETDLAAATVTRFDPPAPPEQMSLL